MKWHSLQKDGTINHYDIQFGNRLVRNIPAYLIESIHEQKHEHEEKLEK